MEAKVEAVPLMVARKNFSISEVWNFENLIPAIMPRLQDFFSRTVRFFSQQV
jgi:hypothetical protein